MKVVMKKWGINKEEKMKKENNRDESSRKQYA